VFVVVLFLLIGRSYRHLSVFVLLCMCLPDELFYLNHFVAANETGCRLALLQYVGVQRVMTIFLARLIVPFCSYSAHFCVVTTVVVPPHRAVWLEELCFLPSIVNTISVFLPSKCCFLA